MFKSVRGRLILIGALVLLCGWSLVPETGENGERLWPLKLGLDLQGGMYLALEVDTSADTLSEAGLNDAVDRTLTTIRNRIDQFGVREPTVQRSGDRIIVELAGIQDPERGKAIVTQTAFLEFKLITDGTGFAAALTDIDEAIVEVVGAENLAVDLLAPEPVPDLSDLLEAPAAEPGTDALPDTAGGAADTVGDAGETGDDDPSAETPAAVLRPLGTLLRQGEGPGIFLAPTQDVPTIEEWLALPEVQELLPRDVELHWGSEEKGVAGATYLELYALEEDPLVTGDRLADAGPASRDPTFNRPIVPFEMTRQGGRIFLRGTQGNIGRNMAIVLDNRVQSYAVIRGPLERRAQIELQPGASLQEAQDLALVLRAGALPMPISVVEERNVSASLGEDSIRQGRIAFILGIIAVVALMLVYYRLAGVLAVGALVTYVILVLGALAGLQATLTLPGIAGLILSIGMAVDANVLIFERVREELASEKTPRNAVESGFSNALSAIVDANLTTLITGAILFQFGTGPVRGFAVTLCIGIIASFFSAVYVTRTLFLIYLNRRVAKTLSI